MSKIKALLNIATHASTPDQEALNAIRKIGALINQTDGGVDALFGHTAPPVRLSFNATRDKISMLETEVSVQASTIARLETELQRISGDFFNLTEENDRLRKASRDRFGRIRDDGTMPYDEFSLRVRRILGSDWRAPFIEQTGIEEKSLVRMSVSGLATKEAVDALSSLKVQKLSERELEKQFWRPEEVQIIRSLAPQCESEQQLAELASIEISKKVRTRIITSRQISKLINDSKHRNNIFSMAGYGSRPIVVGSGSLNRDEIKTRAPAFAWTLFPDIERELALNFIGETGRRKSARVWAEEITQRTGRTVTEGAVKQRLNNAGPPRSVIDAMVTSGPLSWSEIWFYGSKINKRAWNKEFWEFIKMPSRNVGDDISDIPVDKIAKMRAWGRQQMSERELVCDFAKNAGRAGLPRKELRLSCQSVIPIATIRVNDLVQRGDIIVKKANQAGDDIIIHSMYC